MTNDRVADPAADESRPWFNRGAFGRAGELAETDPRFASLTAPQLAVWLAMASFTGLGERHARQPVCWASNAEIGKRARLSDRAVRDALLGNPERTNDKSGRHYRARPGLQELGLIERNGRRRGEDGMPSTIRWRLTALARAAADADESRPAADAEEMMSSAADAERGTSRPAADAEQGSAADAERGSAADAEESSQSGRRPPGSKEDGLISAAGAESLPGGRATAGALDKGNGKEDGEEHHGDKMTAILQRIADEYGQPLEQVRQMAIVWRARSRGQAIDPARFYPVCARNEPGYGQPAKGTPAPSSAKSGDHGRTRAASKAKSTTAKGTAAPSGPKPGTGAAFVAEHQSKAADRDRRREAGLRGHERPESERAAGAAAVAAYLAEHPDHSPHRATQDLAEKFGVSRVQLANWYRAGKHLTPAARHSAAPARPEPAPAPHPANPAPTAQRISGAFSSSMLDEFEEATTATGQDVSEAEYIAMVDDWRFRDPAGWTNHGDSEGDC